MLSTIITAAAASAAYAAVLRIKRGTNAFDHTVHKSEAVQVAYDKLCFVVQKGIELEAKLEAAEIAENTPYVEAAKGVKGFKPAYWRTLLKKNEAEIAKCEEAYNKARACAAMEIVMYGEPKDAKTRLDLKFQKYPIIFKVPVKNGDPAEIKALVAQYEALKADGYSEIDALSANSIETGESDKAYDVAVARYHNLIVQGARIKDPVFETDANFSKNIVNVPDQIKLKYKNGRELVLDFTAGGYDRINHERKLIIKNCFGLFNNFEPTVKAETTKTDSNKSAVSDGINPSEYTDIFYTDIGTACIDIPVKVHLITAHDEKYFDFTNCEDEQGINDKEAISRMRRQILRDWRKYDSKGNLLGW